MNDEELKLLFIAKKNLEKPNLFIKLTDYLGMPLEYGLKKLPVFARNKVGFIVDKSLKASYKIALFTISNNSSIVKQKYYNRAFTTLFGGIGGAFGIGGAIAEIPISTTIIFREMAQNALKHQFDVRDPKVMLEVLSCFSYGGRSSLDDEVNSSYFTVRASLTKSISEAAAYMVEKVAGDLADDFAKPVIVKLLEKIGSRFGVVISDQIAAKSIPIIGAVGAITINNLFLSHFSDISDAHFFILKMERKYGKEIVEKNYLEIEWK